MNRRTVLLAATGALTLSAGCFGNNDDEQQAATTDLREEATIEISDGAFDPSTVHVASGGSVTWENAGDEAYRIDSFRFTASSTRWDYQETVEPGESVTHTFEEDGLYDYTDQSRGGQYTICGRVRVGSADEGQGLPCK